jgi:uncharacterized protein (DUF2141 family)
MSKRFVYSFFISGVFLLQFVTAFSQSNSLDIRIKNARNNNGVLRVTLFTKEKDYMRNFETYKIVSAKSDEVRVIFENLPSGEYALTVFHDENNNGKMDSNFLGIPKEGTGFSNDAAALFGPPSWAKAKFAWNGESKPHIIHLKYF